MIRVLIVDDHMVVRFGLAAIISLQPDMTVEGEASSAEEACALCKERPFDPEQLRVEIEDDGLGFDSRVDHDKDSHHYGLVGMRERAEQLGGEFHLASTPGKGTRLRLTVPISRRGY